MKETLKIAKEDVRSILLKIGNLPFLNKYKTILSAILLNLPLQNYPGLDSAIHKVMENPNFANILLLIGQILLVFAALKKGGELLKG